MSDSHEIEIQPDNHGIEDRVFSKIKADLSSSSLLSSSSTEQPEICKIRKVQPTMSAYTPRIISIGPLHHGKPELQPMEDFKHKYLNDLLTGGGEGKSDELLGRFIEAAISMEQEVRESYELSDINTISSDAFVKMFVIDGCFLLEYLHSFNNYPKRQGLLIDHDIKLFENQIPFFVLQKFHEILTEFNQDYYKTSIVEVAHSYMTENHVTFGFAFSVAFPTAFKRDFVEPKNLLHLHYVNVEGVNVEGSWNLWILFLSFCVFPCLFCSFPDYWALLFLYQMAVVLSQIFTSSTNITYQEVISATEIEEAGVRFQGSRMDLRFKKGTLTIPVLTLNQESLRLLKNLMVFEFYFRSGRVRPYVHEYVSFLSLLIKNPGDLKVMEKHRIIRTSGGGDESFALVNELIQSGFEELMTGYSDDLNWQSRVSIIDDLKTYCKEPRHRWRAMLMKDYFGNPWSILGVLGGVILLVLTTLQTVFTVKSFYHQ